MGDDNSTGSAYVFAFDGTTWSQEAKLTASDRFIFDSFGASISLSRNRALVGSALDDDNGADTGPAYIFLFDGTTWSQEGKLTASDGATNDTFGSTVSLSQATAPSSGLPAAPLFSCPVRPISILSTARLGTSSSS